MHNSALGVHQSRAPRRISAWRGTPGPAEHRSPLPQRSGPDSRQDVRPVAPDIRGGRNRRCGSAGAGRYTRSMPSETSTTPPPTVTPVSAPFAALTSPTS